MNILDIKRKLLPLSGYMGGGGDSGGGGSQTSTSYNTNIPEYARPFVETMLGSAQQELFEYGPSDAKYEDVPIYQETPGYRGMPGIKTQIGTERKLVPGTGEMVPKGLKPCKAFGGTYDERKTITTPEGEIPNPNYGKQTAYDPTKYFAGPSDLQNNARNLAEMMGVTPETRQAVSMTNAAGQGGFDSADRAYGYGKQGFQYGNQGANLGMQGGNYYGNMGAGYGAQAADVGQMGLRAEQYGRNISGQAEDYARRAANARQNTWWGRMPFVYRNLGLVLHLQAL